MKINSKYLVFGVNGLTSSKKVKFISGGDTVYELNMRLDGISPDFYAFIDLSRFLGRDIEIVTEPQVEYSVREADSIDLEGIYSEPLRPQVHFTPKNGWMNDPNGLIYLDGVYHMFYQYNPTQNRWDNMHWGHAVSRDLVRWEEKDTALFPENNGMKYSGSAVLADKASGFYSDKPGAAVLFYTDTSDYSQRTVYSRDGFVTLETPEKSTSVPHIVHCNRDPKAVYCDELQKYIMAIYLTADRYALFSSADLLCWTQIQDIDIPGDSECPDIFPINDTAGGRHWVIMGACDKYIIGDFENGKFVPKQNVKSLHYGNSAYAGQTFANMPDGRTVRMVWDRWDVPTKRINGQMGFPMEFSLAKNKGEYYIAPTPAKELQLLYKSAPEERNITLSAENGFSKKLESTPYFFEFSGKSDNETQISVSVFGRNFTFDFSGNVLKFGNNTMPISLFSDDFNVKLICDRCSFEFFSPSGASYMTFADIDSVCDYNLPQLTIKSDRDFGAMTVTTCPLDSIWK